MQRLVEGESTSEMSVSRLSASETPKRYIDLDLLQELQSEYCLDEVVKLIGVSKKTLTKYRILAYKFIPEYQESCTNRFPSYQLQKEVERERIESGVTVRPLYPDPPPFTKIEVDILKQIAELYKSKMNGKRMSDRQVEQVLTANQQQRVS
ncbi:MAG: hypothetical protein F6K14_10665 [Symploca sp. SIO2C1]|nr:hypothetical protein [Symploca sp. SIO2C1]